MQCRGGQVARRVLSPAVLWRVRAHNLDVQQIKATGPKGNLLKGDVLHFLSNHPPSKVSKPKEDNRSIQAKASSALHPSPGRISLLLPARDLEPLRTFADGRADEELLLVKCICHALTKTLPPTTSIILHRKDSSRTCFVLGSPLQAMIMSDKKNSMETQAKVQIFLQSREASLGADSSQDLPTIFVRKVGMDVEQIEVEILHGSNSLSLPIISPLLLQDLSESLRDPTLLLL